MLFRHVNQLGEDMFEFAMHATAETLLELVTVATPTRRMLMLMAARLDYVRFVTIVWLLLLLLA
jgi:hypothetical protein